MNNQIEHSELVPAMRFLQDQKNLYPNKDSARFALNVRANTGLASATVKVGRKLFISPSLFAEWMSSNIEG